MEGITEVTNITLKEIAEKFLELDDFILCGHMNPDGDCISSCLALNLALLQIGKKVSVVCAEEQLKTDFLDFLPNYSKIKYCGKVKDDPNVFVMIDVPNDKRMGHAASALKSRCAHKFTIDHHLEKDKWADFVFTDTSSASCSMIVWELIKCLGVELTPEIATCCLTGVYTDTGNFQWQNSDIRAFRSALEMIEAGAVPYIICENVNMRRSMASLRMESVVIDNCEIFCDGKAAISTISKEDLQRVGATKADCELLINLLRSIDGTEIVAIIREDGNTLRASLRALGNRDVRAIAMNLGGGGHVGAAGCTFKCSLEEGKKIVKAEIEKAFSLD